MSASGSVAHSNVFVFELVTPKPKKRFMFEHMEGDQGIKGFVLARDAADISQTRSHNRVWSYFISFHSQTMFRAIQKMQTIYFMFS